MLQGTELQTVINIKQVLHWFASIIVSHFVCTIYCLPFKVLLHYAKYTII